jgi:hypothetical protein
MATGAALPATAGGGRRRKFPWLVLLAVVALVALASAVVLLALGYNALRSEVAQSAVQPTVQPVVYTNACPTQVPTTSPKPTLIPTATVTPTTTVTSSVEPTCIESSVVPADGATWTVDVKAGEIVVLTGGPMKVNGHEFPGGVDRGSVLVLQPGKYDIRGLYPKANWFCRLKTTDWRAVLEDRVSAMKAAPNCTAGGGCKTVDTLVLQGTTKVYGETFR